MSAVPLPLLLLAGAVLLAMGRAAAAGARPLRSVLASAVSGVGALSAVDLLAPFTGVSLAVNPVTAFVSVVLGAPGVITLLLLDLLMV